jgi:hypothetical protein
MRIDLHVENAQTYRQSLTIVQNAMLMYASEAQRAGMSALIPHSLDRP